MILKLFLAEFRRSWLLFVRYPINAIGQTFITIVIFYGLFLGIGYMGGSDFTFGERFDAIVIGYVLWTLVLSVMDSLAGELQYEAQTGTLEQVFLSPFGASLVFLMRAIASVALNLLMMVAILLIIMLLTGASLSFPPLLILPLLTVLLGAYGLAFISGSLALLFKQIQQVLGLFQFVLLFLLTAPVETWKFPIQAMGWLLPMASGAGLLRDLMARDLPLHFGELAIAFGNGIAYFTLGLVIFRFCEQQVKKQGKLGSF